MLSYLDFINFFIVKGLIIIFAFSTVFMLIYGLINFSKLKTIYPNIRTIILQWLVAFVGVIILAFNIRRDLLWLVLAISFILSAIFYNTLKKK